MLRRLLELNHRLYEEEVAAGLHDKKSKKREELEPEEDGIDSPEEVTEEAPAQRSFNFT